MSNNITRADSFGANRFKNKLYNSNGHATPYPTNSNLSLADIYILFIQGRREKTHCILFLLLYNPIQYIKYSDSFGTNRFKSELYDSYGHPTPYSKI